MAADDTTFIIPDHLPPAPRRRRPGPAVTGAVAGAVIAVALGGVALLTGVLGARTTHVVRGGPALAAVAVPSVGGAGIDARGIYTREAPGVVQVTSAGVTESTPFGQASGTGTGSGFVLDRRGDILTNNHVVDGAHSVSVSFANGSSIPAKVVGRDTSTDLAVLRIDPARATLDPLPLGSSAAAHVGDPVVAIGNPFGLDRTITEGIVSAKQREITAPDGFAIDDVLQTDAPINPGNSGGPLIDAHGRVIGITSQIATGSGSNGNVGIGFAVPIETARAELPALERGGTMGRGFLGVSVAPLTGPVAQVLSLPTSTKGVLVQQVSPGGPAATAGLRGGTVTTEAGILLGGDVITAVDGRPVTSTTGLAAAIAHHRSGQGVTVTYLRGKASHTAKVTLTARPAADDTASAGASLPSGLAG